jgi:hypothetical protein
VLNRDSLLAQWRPLAKDGALLPPSARVLTSAPLILSIGETHDFEVTPAARGNLRIEVRTSGPGRLLARVPVRVE